MLARAESALGSRSTTDKGKIRDNTALTLFVPQCRDVQEWIQEPMKLDDEDDKKFWVEED